MYDDKICFRCCFNDEDYGCTCPDFDRWYACPIENNKEENINDLKDYAKKYIEEYKNV